MRFTIVMCLGLVGIFGLGNQVQAKPAATSKYERVLVTVHLSPKSKKKWDLRTEPDLSLCVGKRCWPRSKSYAGPPNSPKQIQRALCENSRWCWIGCSNQQRVYLSRLDATEFKVYDVDRYSSNDLIGELSCRREKGKETTCRGKHVSITLTKHSTKLCRELAASKPKNLVH